jgi:hypothetical protein
MSVHQRVLAKIARYTGHSKLRSTLGARGQTRLVVGRVDAALLRAQVSTARSFRLIGLPFWLGGARPLAHIMPQEGIHFNHAI